MLAALGTAFALYVISPVLYLRAFQVMPADYVLTHADGIMRLSVLFTSLGMTTVAAIVIGLFIPSRPVVHAAIAAALLDVPTMIVNRSRSATELVLAFCVNFALAVIVAACVFAIRTAPNRHGDVVVNFDRDLAR